MKQVGHSNGKSETFVDTKWVFSTLSLNSGGGNGPKRGQKEAWDQVKGCGEAPRRHRGGTKEAPRRHQGGTKEAPGNDLHIDMGPRALKKEN